MPCTEAYKEHIMYTFNGFCKTVIRFTAINAWRDRSRRRQKEISLEYLTEEKFYPLGTTDEYFEAPYEEYPVTVCGQKVILTNRELAEALSSLPEKKREIIYLYFFGRYTQQEIKELYGRCPEYDWVSNPQDFTTSAQRNGGAFAWRIRTFYLMKRLFGRPAGSRKPWTRFYGTTESKSGLPPLKTGISTKTQRTA